MKDPGLNDDGIAVTCEDSSDCLNRQGLSARALLLTVFGRLVAAEVMHRLAVKLCAALRRMFSPRRHWPVIAFAVIEMMIDVPVEMLRPVKPRTRADEYAAREPIRAIVAVRRAVIGRNLIVPIRANWRLSYADCNLCIRFMCGS
jgi:hypothetical protein